MEKRIIPTMKKCLYAALCALCLSGCYSLDSAPVANFGREHVLVRNYGWSLFNCIPILCGNAAKDPACSFVMFRDDVTMEKIRDRFDEYAAGRSVECPVLHVDDNKFISIYNIPIPYIVCYKEVSFSATLGARKDKTEKTEAGK